MSNSTLPANVTAFWDSFVSNRKLDQIPTLREAFHFCDNERDADSLADLVMLCTKRATASSLWWCEREQLPLPQIGNLNIVTRWDGTPCCVIETTTVNIAPFDAVTPEFAASEGDKSLAYWREEHWAYFSRECKELEMVPTLQMPVVCEEFKVIFRASD